ncbi:hypothetical protein N658DRAFT_523090 [Parathielavia hyrcaniae]|uniref:Tetraspanin n=1 Tax=Parathielavia hyrcaniae TaxID=113614 RepID=A0AAN6Q2V3_9PEZI|nr:hypothetical protein N658DRAFT_523090 [Parathielavia hyrcaniae]
MALLLLLYTLIILALVGIAIYEHITIATLSLPISPALTILTILLPLLSPLTTLTTPILFQRQPSRKRITSSSSSFSSSSQPPLPLALPTLLPLGFNLLQLTLTTILTTLYASILTPQSTTTCLLTQRWTALWRAHDARAIQHIQDGLGCCGLRSTRDMAWPFPRGEHPDRGAACETQFGRHSPCLPGWEGSLRAAAGGEMTVVLCVGLLQVLAVVLAGRGARERGYGFGGEGWVSGLGGWFWGAERRAEAGRRPLLQAGTERAGDGVGYQDVVEEEEREEDGPADNERRDREEVEQRRGAEGYGAVGPRVEPTQHDPWAGAQRGYGAS